METLFSPFQVRHFNKFRAISLLLSRWGNAREQSKCLWTYKIHHHVKYQRLNANTLYVAILSIPFNPTVPQLSTAMWGVMAEPLLNFAAEALKANEIFVT